MFSDSKFFIFINVYQCNLNYYGIINKLTLPKVNASINS